MNSGFSQKSRDSGYPITRSSYQSSCLQTQPLLLDSQIQADIQLKSPQERLVPSFYDNVLPDLSIMDNCYDVSGDNHCFACTVIYYKKPLDDRISAENDHFNLENSMTKRGYLFTPKAGYVTREDFKNELLTVLSQMTTSTTSFVLSISCHGEGDRLVFSDERR